MKNSTELHYFVSNDASPTNLSKGYIDLRKATHFDIEEKERKPSDLKYVFHIHLPERDYVLAASSDTERNYW